MKSKHDKALEVLELDPQYKHVIYGYRANNKDLYFHPTYVQSCVFRDDDSYINYIDYLQTSISKLNCIYAVHR